MELNESKVPYRMIYPEKNTHKLRSFLSNFRDYLKSDFCCSAPKDGGVGGYFLMNMNIRIKAMAEARN